MRTAGPVAGVRLTADRSEIAADGQDLAFIDVESIDASGLAQPTGCQNVTFSVEGPGTIAAVGSADYGATQSYQSNQCKLFHGRAQIVIRAGRLKGQVKVRASVEGQPVAENTVTVR